MYHGTRFTLTITAALAIWGSAMLFGMNSTANAQDSSPPAHKVAMSSQSPGWAERLKGQTIIENSIEGRPERAAMVELQHQRLMQQMQKDKQHRGDTDGAFNSMSMMHQYGAGPGNGLLASNSGVQSLGRVLNLWDLSQAEAARLFGVSRQAVSKWVAKGPPAERTESIADLAAAMKP